jgi:acetyl esterase/lipase
VAQASAPVRESHTYKVVGGQELQLDVIGSRNGESRPCVVWIHGGGLIFGSRTTSPRDSLLSALAAEDLVVVTIDHRLAPEAKLADIVDDVRDAWRWIHESAPALGVATGKVAIAGASAGAYLSLLAGYLFEPRPCAIASLFGFGDIAASWEADPSPYYRTMELQTREAAVESLAAPAIQDPSAGTDRSAFYLYCRQQGLWLEEVTGHDPAMEPTWFDRYCPVRNISSTYPSTILVHGTLDSDVPHEESARLAERLVTHGVGHQFISMPGVGHGFAGASPEQVREAEAAVAAFLKRSAACAVGR